MKRTLFLFVLLITAAQICAQTEEVTAEFLEGGWSRVMMDQADSCIPPEEYVPRRPSDNVWIVRNDSISIYVYPFTFLGKYEFSVSNDSLFISTDYHVEMYWHRKYFYATMKYDSDILTLSMPECVTMKFKRDTFSSDTARLLKVLDRDTINPGLILEKYYMVTHFVPDDAEAYDFKPPVRMQTKFTIHDSAEARRIYHDQIIYLKAGGKKLPFRVLSVDWEYEIARWGKNFELVSVPVIVVQPTDWWTGELFRVEFRANEVEVAKKRRK